MEECSVLIETTKSAEDKISRWFDLPIDYELFRDLLGVEADSGDYQIIDMKLSFAGDIVRTTWNKYPATKAPSWTQKFQKGDIELKNAVTNVSHDLRTLLTAIYGYLDLLEQEEKSEKVNRYIAVIKNRTEMLKQLTEELFRYSVILTSEEDLKIEPIGKQSCYQSFQLM